MSNSYTWVHWNRHKKIYDACVASGIVLYLGTYVGVGMALRSAPSQVSPEILLIRALATCAILMLHVILCIGPLARLTPRAAPLLYNRRHLGVSMFLVSLAHATLATLYYGGFAGRNPLLAVLAGQGANASALASIGGFPFEILGFIALLILFVMAATSHDFWLANLSPRVWKGLHMLVYLAYALLVLHACLGFLQSERSPVYPALVGVGVAVVGVLHIIAGWREVAKEKAGIDSDPARADGRSEPSPGARWVDVGSVDEIPESRAKVVCLKDGARGQRVAVYRNDGAISALSNVCAHQGGPLGEGKIVGGCVTCPWHGYQYLAHNGQSPPPFTEKVPTYQVRVEGRRILLNPRALPPGTPVEPARFAPAASPASTGATT